jgi:hypothetical protein
VLKEHSCSTFFSTKNNCQCMFRPLIEKKEEAA